MLLYLALPVKSQMAEADGDLPEEAKTALQDGICRMGMNDYSSALSCFRKCLVISGGKGDEAADACLDIGSILFLQNDVEGALTNFQKAWIIQLEIEKNNPVKLFQILINLGIAYLSNDEITKGNICLTHAEKILKQISPADPELTVALYLNLASSSGRMKQYEAERSYYRMSLLLPTGCQSELSQSRFIANKGIAVSFLNSGVPDSSLFFLQQATEVIPEDAGEWNNQRADAYSLMGDISRMRKDFSTASHYYHAALSEILHTSDQAAVNFSIKNLNDIDLSRLLPILKKNADILFQLGICPSEDTVFLQEAAGFYDQAILLAGWIRRGIGKNGSLLLFNDEVKGVFSGAMEVTYRLWQSGHPEYKEKLFLLSEAARAGILRREVRVQQAGKLVPETDSLFREQRQVREEIASIINRKPGSTIIRDADEFRFRVAVLEKEMTLKSENDSIVEKIRRNLAGYMEPENNTGYMESSTIRRNLRKDDALLEYYRADSSLYCMAFTSDTFVVTKVSIGSSFGKWVMNFQGELKKANAERNDSSALRLSRILIDPVLPYVKGRRHITIIPDDEVNVMAFEALPVGGKKETPGEEQENFRYLIQDFEIDYHFTAGSCFRRAEEKSPKTCSYMGFAPVFRSRNQDKHLLDPLVSSYVEVSRIAALFRNRYRNAVIFTDSEATKSRFTGLSEYCSVLHIATHSVTDIRHPENTGLAFSLEGKDLSGESGEENILWGNEIENLCLHTDLVVLSACATGKGKLSRSEGMLAMPRYFYSAGASAILFTLWNIPDRQTKDFMISFYREFLSGESYSSALRAAKLDMIRHPETSRPYLWAGFVLVGGRYADSDPFRRKFSDL